MTLNRLLKNSQRRPQSTMGEIILIISITLILTILSSFWLGYAYGKLRTIKSYETSQKQIFIDYISQDEKGAPANDGE